jgi:hypothetical protein
MVANDQSFEFELQPHALREIEHFADLICDQLFINETYYGNILMALTEFFDLLLKTSQEEMLKATYSTDYQEIKIQLQPIEPELITRFEQELNIDTLSDEKSDKSIYLIKKLVDNIDFPGKDSVSLVFDISALHNEVYEHRKSHLHSYFSETREKKVKEKDDQL